MPKVMSEDVKRRISESVKRYHETGERSTHDSYSSTRLLEQCRKQLVSDIMEMTDDELRAQLRNDLMRGFVFPLEGESKEDEKAIWRQRHEFLLIDEETI